MYLVLIAGRCLKTAYVGYLRHRLHHRWYLHSVGLHHSCRIVGGEHQRVFILHAGRKAAVNIGLHPGLKAVGEVFVGLQALSLAIAEKVGGAHEGQPRLPGQKPADAVIGVACLVPLDGHLPVPGHGGDYPQRPVAYLRPLVAHIQGGRVFRFGAHGVAVYAVAHAVVGVVAVAARGGIGVLVALLVLGHHYLVEDLPVIGLACLAVVELALYGQHVGTEGIIFVGMGHYPREDGGAALTPGAAEAEVGWVMECRQGHPLGAHAHVLEFAVGYLSLHLRPIGVVSGGQQYAVALVVGLALACNVFHIVAIAVELHHLGYLHLLSRGVGGYHLMVAHVLAAGHEYGVADISVGQVGHVHGVAHQRLIAQVLARGGRGAVDVEIDGQPCIRGRQVVVELYVFESVAGALSHLVVVGLVVGSDGASAVLLLPARIGIGHHQHGVGQDILDFHVRIAVVVLRIARTVELKGVDGLRRPIGIIESHIDQYAVGAHAVFAGHVVVEVTAVKKQEPEVYHSVAHVGNHEVGVDLKSVGGLCILRRSQQQCQPQP